MPERFKKMLDAIIDILEILPLVVEDTYKGVTGLFLAIKAGDIQEAINALVRLVAIVETIMKQLTTAVSDLLDIARTDGKS